MNYQELADQIIEESLKTLPVYKQAYDDMVNLAASGKSDELDNYISTVRQYFDDDVINYINNVKFKQKVLPGDTLIFKAELISPIRRGICHMQSYGYANGKLVVEAELMAQLVRKS